MYSYSLQYCFVDKSTSALNYLILDLFDFSLKYTTNDSVCGNYCIHHLNFNRIQYKILIEGCLFFFFLPTESASSLPFIFGIKG